MSSALKSAFQSTSACQSDHRNSGRKSVKGSLGYSKGAFC